MHITKYRQFAGPKDGYRGEVDHIMALEYDHFLNVALRVFGVPLAGILISVYTNSMMSTYWSILYVLSYIAIWVYAKKLSAQVSVIQCRVTHLLVLLNTTAYIWFPAWTFSQLDRNLFLVGAGLIGAQLVQLVHRADTSSFLIFGNIIIVFIGMLAFFGLVLPQISSPLALFGIVASWLALLGVLAQSMLGARKRIMAKNAADNQAFQAQKLASIGQLAGGVAHDFNNIITAISGNLELYEVLADDNEKDQAVAAAHEASLRAAKVVKQILVYARQSPLRFTMINANAPLYSLKILTDHLIPSKVSFTIHPLTEAPMINVDASQIETALLNLVLNAVDATPSGGNISLSVHIVETKMSKHVAGGRSLDSGSYVAYKVVDSGSGIPQDVLKFVIDPFFTTKGVGKGTGLGLSMVFGLADSMGGGLEIQTSQSGTTMTMFIPV